MKATRTTLKSFINKNRANLLIRRTSSFDGMTDGVESTGVKDFSPIVASDRHADHTYGIEGIWMVLRGNDWISELEIDGLKGYHVYNCCGSFDIAVRV